MCNNLQIMKYVIKYLINNMKNTHGINLQHLLQLIKDMDNCFYNCVSLKSKDFLTNQSLYK